MSIRTVRSEIKTAMKAQPFESKRITGTEARRIINEAKKGPVTTGEIRELQKLVDNGIDPSGAMTKRAPELSGDQFYMANSTKATISEFIDRNSSWSPPTNFTLAIPEHPNDSAVTLAIPEHPGDSLRQTMAIPEHPGDSRC